MKQPATEASILAEDLRARPREELIQLIAQLRSIMNDQAQVIEEITNERDAARLLNELCHFDSPLHLNEPGPDPRSEAGPDEQGRPEL